MEKQIISFDVDMTLYDDRTNEIPASTLRALNELKPDAFIVIATGRNMDAEASRQIRDQVRPDAIIHTNGTRVTVGQKQIVDQHMDKELLERLIRFARESVVCIGTTIDGIHYYSNLRALGPLEKFDQDWGNGKNLYYPIESLYDKEVRTLSLIGDERDAANLASHFPELNVPMVLDGTCADVIPKGVSKAHGMQSLLDYLGASMEQVVAFGDSLNDIELIVDAGTGVAMGNAHPELKKAADYVTDPIERDGIWNAVQHLHLI